MGFSGVWFPMFFKICFCFRRRNICIQFCNHMRVRKLLCNFHFGVNYPCNGSSIELQNFTSLCKTRWSMLSSMWKLSKEHFVQRVHMEDKWRIPHISYSFELMFWCRCRAKRKTNVSLSEISDSLLLTTALISFVQTLECKFKINSS